MKKTTLVPLSMTVTLVASLALTGCSSSSSSDKGSTDATKDGSAASQVLNLSYAVEPPALDVSTTSANAAFTFENMINEGLYRQGPDGKPQPAIAKDMPEVSPDGKTYTFHLRDGATWSDGSPVKAGDFEFSIKRSLDPASKCEYAEMIGSWIKGASDYNTGKGTVDNVGVKALDDKTLKIELINPLPFFTEALTFPLFFPQQKEFVEKYPGKFGADADKTISNGPFKMESWTHEQNMTFVKNDKYWDAANVKLDKVTVQIVKDQMSAMNLYQTNEIDFLDVNREQVSDFKGKPELTLNPEIVAFYLQFNASKIPALKNAKIRKALSLSVDRQAFCDVILGNGSMPSTGYIPNRVNDGAGGEFRKDAGDTQEKFNPEEAKKLLADGLKEIGADKMPKISIMADDTESAKKTIDFLQAQFRQNLGVDVEAEPVPHKLRLDKQRNKDYDIVVSGWSGDYNDPVAYLEIWETNSPFNNNGYSNKDYDKLVDDARVEKDAKKRADMLVQAEKILMNDAPIGPIYFRSKAYVKRPSVQGMFFPQTGAEFELKYTHIEGKN